MIRYDLTRAARAGGFDEDLELGRTVVEMLRDARAQAREALAAS